MNPTPIPELPTINDEILWHGVLDRDANLDGRIFYAVRSTGVYCRPSCPSRRPLRRNVVFFHCHHAAERAGFRPCKRCVPRVHAEAAEGREMAEELRLAAEIQRALLPDAVPVPDGWDLAFASTPCGDVGGDHLDLFRLRLDGRLVLALGDVTGKGVPAALSASCLHAGLRAQLESRPEVPHVVAELGSGPLEDLLLAAAGAAAASVGDRLEALVDAHAEGREPADDRSWLVLRRVAEVHDA